MGMTTSENISNFRKRDNAFKFSNIVPHKGIKLECKYISVNVLNLSKGYLSTFEISLLSRGLSHVLTAGKIDRAKLKIVLEE